MQVLKSNKAQFEYDIHALVKAFYPAWELKIVTPESVVKDRRVKRAVPVMELEFDESEVRFTVHKGLHNIEEKDLITADGSAGTEGKNRENLESSVYTWRDTDQVEPSAYKDMFKRFLYQSLQEETGLVLPWGNLTGIRPTKIAKIGRAHV